MKCCRFLRPKSYSTLLDVTLTSDARACKTVTLSVDIWSKGAPFRKAYRKKFGKKLWRRGKRRSSVLPWNFVWMWGWLQQMDIEQMLFHQDNAPPHRSTDTTMTIDFLGFHRLEHSPYSPDLAPMDFATFPRLKAGLRGRRFTDIDELRLAVRSMVGTFEKRWYMDVYEKWVVRHKKCITYEGEYFEKYWRYCVSWH